MRFILILFLTLTALTAKAAETWQSALSQMPLGTNVSVLNRSNCVKLMLNAFQSNATVKALIFMPGATDEFYMFRRAKAVLTNSSPTLLDAVNALTNQTYIRVTFHPPLLLLHTDEDPLEPLIVTNDLPTVRKLEATPFLPHALFNDNDWDFLLPILTTRLQVSFSPGLYSTDSFHFYRHSMAAWDLNGMEALEAISQAGKEKFEIDKDSLKFDPDVRYRSLPKTDHYNTE